MGAGGLASYLGVLLVAVLQNWQYVCLRWMSLKWMSQQSKAYCQALMVE